MTDKQRMDIMVFALEFDWEGQPYIVYIFRKYWNTKMAPGPDIIYHDAFEGVGGLEEFKKSADEDLSAFPDLRITILDDFGDQTKLQ